MARLVHLPVLLPILLVLAACGEKAPSPAQVTAAHSRDELHKLQDDLIVVENDVRSFLISDPNARLCLVSKETAAFQAAFDALGAEIDKEIQASDALAMKGTVDARFKDEAEQADAEKAFVEKARTALSGAKIASRLLHASANDRPGFKKRADLAWWSVLSSSEAAAPWINRAIENGGDQAAEAKASSKAMLALVDQAIRLHGRIELSWSDISGSKPYDCSNWAVDITTLENVAAAIKQQADDLTRRWAPAVPDNGTPDSDRPGSSSRPATTLDKTGGQ